MAQLGKYDILEELGRGGFGIVYKARDISLERLVALKVLHPQLTVDASFLDRFRKEAHALARINHPNVVTIHEVGEVEGKVYIAMEYLPGGSLDEKLNDEPLLLEEALKVTSEVATGLGAGHEEGLVHRDVKPGNILFNKRGEAVIADFGLAKALRKSSSYIKSSLGRAVGTPYYRAPELWKGKPPPTPTTDIYSLGCVLFEMLTMEVLFRGDTEEELITKHLLEDAHELMDACQVQVPARIQEVLEKALAKEPSQRYQGMAAFLQALSPKQEKQQAVLEETTSKVPGQAVQRTAAQVEPDRVYKPSSQRDDEESISKPDKNKAARKPGYQFYVLLRNHTRENFWQIVLPIILGVLLILTAAVLVYLPITGVDTGVDISQYSNLSSIILTLLGFVSCFFIIIILLILNLGVAWITKTIKGYLKAESSRTLSR